MSKHALINWGRLAIAASLGLALAACGGGGSDGSGTGTVSVGITDTPVDEAEAVVVTVTAVEFNGQNGERLEFVFVDENGDPQPKTVDLLAQQGGLREMLLEDETLPAGTYTWTRLSVDTEPRSENGDVVFPSYIQFAASSEYAATYDCLPVDNSVQCPMEIPSSENSGLKINTPFTVSDDNNTDITIDFDLRKSLTKPEGQTVNVNGTEYDLFKLRPTLRLVMTEQSGTIEGTVGGSLFAAEYCLDEDDPTSTGEENGAVYVFEGDVTPDDIDGNDPDPQTVAPVQWDDGAEAYVYRASYLDAGTYTVAFTCEADRDESDVDESEPPNEPIRFEDSGTVNVTSGQVTTFDFI